MKQPESSGLVIKCVRNAIIGAISGFIAFIVIGIAIYIIVIIFTWNSDSASAASNWALLCVPTGIAIGIMIPLREEKERRDYIQSSIQAEKESKARLENRRIEEENKRIKEENKRIEYREPIMRKMTHEINCPECEGTGECVKVRDFSKRADGTRMDSPDSICYITKSTYEHRREIGLIIDGRRNETDDWVEIYTREQCPFCRGKGRAYAYFVNRTDECSSCHGHKRVQIQRKADIGMENVWVECESCKGTGIINRDYVHYLHRFDVPDEKPDREVPMSSFFSKRSSIRSED